jgi:hypothetical protein
MADPLAWIDPLDLLASQLFHGRLMLVLGAGISFGFNLPSWNELTKRAASIAKCVVPASLTPEESADHILHNGCNGDELKFATVVREGLYQGYDSSVETLSANRLLAALGALTMASARGKVTTVVSYNFDDLLEKFLAYHGFVVNSVARMPSWKLMGDVNVYHPHGILPSDLGESVSNPIVMAQVHYDQRGNASWRNLQVNEFSRSTCLFLGLSGKDNNLKSILTEVKPIHASSQSGGLGDAYWGVRFSDNKADPLGSSWDQRGISQLTVNDYAELPNLLFDICRRAAALASR